MFRLFPHVMKRAAMLAAAMILGLTCAVAQRFAILSDIHVTPGNENERQLRLAVEEINRGDAQVVLMTGDLTNEGSDEQLRNVKSILDGITKPLYVIPGNHENNWSQSACKTFVDLWGNGRFVFEIDSLVVIGLNCGPFMKMGDGHIKQEDLAWLERELQARVKPGKRVLSINHYPLKDDLDNYIAYHDVLRRFPVVLHLNGHYHNWWPYETGAINGVMVRALDMKEGNYGYSLLEVRGDSTFLWDKRLGHDPEFKFAFARDTRCPLPAIEGPKLETEIHGGRVDVTLVHRDEASIFTRVAVDKERIYFGNSLGQAKAVDKNTDVLCWSYPTSAMLFSRPAVAGDAVIVPTADHRLLWLDKRTGQELWCHEAEGPYVADGVVHKGILYQGGYMGFEAYDVKNHRQYWRREISNYCQAEPVVDGREVIFGAWDTKLRCLDRLDGRIMWEWDNGRTVRLLSPGNVVPIVTKKSVVIVAPDRYATALDRKTGKQLWRFHDDGIKVRESLGHSRDGRTAYAKTMDGTLVAFDTQSPEYRKLWEVNLGLGYEHAPCIVLEHKGLIFTGSRRGRLTVVDAKTHQVVLAAQLGTSEVNGFDIDPSTGHIYCSLIEGTIFRLKVK